MLKRSSTCSEPLAGELIVRNGPDRGVCRSLLVPITLVGSAESCDLRILDETVRAIHCAVSVTPDGPHLRSVGGLTPERIDMGVDYAGYGPIYAIGDGIVLTTTVPGWPGGTMIGLRLYTHPIADFIVEALVIFGGALLYARTLPPRRRPWADLAIMAGALIALQLSIDVAHLLMKTLPKC